MGWISDDSGSDSVNNAIAKKERGETVTDHEMSLIRGAASQAGERGENAKRALGES